MLHAIIYSIITTLFFIVITAILLFTTGYWNPIPIRILFLFGLVILISMLLGVYIAFNVINKSQK